MKEIRLLEQEKGIHAAISTRERSAEQVREDLTAQDLVVARACQVHGDRIRQITNEDIARHGDGQGEIVCSDTDGFITDCRGVALTTVHADCIPIFLYDRKAKAIGMVHGGWRGTCAGIGAKAAEMMIRRYSAAPETMCCAIGPGIGPCCFEVGQEVYEAFRQQYAYVEEYAKRGEDGKFYLDLKGMNRRQLADLGIRNIEVSSHCTFCREDLYFSYRREGAAAGRLVASIYLE